MSRVFQQKMKRKVIENQTDTQKKENNFINKNTVAKQRPTITKKLINKMNG